MKNRKSPSAAIVAGLVVLVTVVWLSILPMPTFASGGSGSGSAGGTTSSVDTIKVDKCYYSDTGSYVELLLKAASSDSSAHLYAFCPDGTYLGEVQNGGGGRYGGTVLGTYHVPESITFISSSGGTTTAPTLPMQL